MFLSVNNVLSVYDLRRVSETTSNRQAGQIVDNINMRVTTQQQFAYKQDYFPIQDFSISKQARLLPPRPRTTFSTDLIKNRSVLVSTHLKKDFRSLSVARICGGCGKVAMSSLLMDQRIHQSMCEDKDVVPLFLMKPSSLLQLEKANPNIATDIIRIQAASRVLKLSSKDKVRMYLGIEDLLETIRDENETLDEKWNEISDIYTKCSEENIRRQAKKKVNDTKSPRLKDKYQQEYSDIHRNVKTLVRADKRKFMDNLADQAEEAANKREQGNLYKITKIICGKSKSSPNIPVKDKQGNLLTSEKEQEKKMGRTLQ
ncbi:Hypothetical predicted protein [Mytilus galloprovincialis]|uniref:Uncharacterized protein n=1 Tax=Mytilus galloprovincialis TaxID=29158 RepID=A0A8B6HCK7_MYTGA|nr:Hypothetical predicted protein [Mytilus galloprovincialis]